MNSSPRLAAGKKAQGQMARKSTGKIHSNVSKKNLKSDSNFKVLNRDQNDDKSEAKSLTMLTDIARDEELTDLQWSDVETVDEFNVMTPGSRVQWQEDDLVGLRNRNHEFVGIFQPNSENLRSLKLIYLLGKRLIQKSDTFVVLKLNSEQAGLQGTTRLWKFKEFKKRIASRFKPLVTQGSIIGETAQTLLADEFLITTFGGLSYGLNNSISIGSNLSGLVIGAPNLKMKARAFQGDFQTWSIGVNIAQDRSSDEKLMNLDIMWDSVLSDTLVAHSIVSAAVISFDEARDVAALKSYGSSSIQSGYEYIMADWGRILAGPSYNIEQKAIGGYLSYVKILSNTHFQISLTSNNVRKLNFSAEEGYLAFVEAYWRW